MERVGRREVELVAVRTADIGPAPELRLPGAEPLAVTGPTLLELDGATCWIAPGWVGVRDGTGESGTNSTLRITRM